MKLLIKSRTTFSSILFSNILSFFHIRRGGGVFDQPLQRLERKVFMLIGGELGTVDNAAHDTFPNMGMTDRIGAVIILLGFGFNPFTSIG